MKIDVVGQGGGLLGAWADGCIEELVRHAEVETFSGTSALATSGLRLVWAQARAEESTGQSSGPQYRESTARFFDKATSHMWGDACLKAKFARNLDHMAALAPAPLVDLCAMNVWQLHSDAVKIMALSPHGANSSNIFLTMLQSNLWRIEDDLQLPHVARLVTNAVNMETGAEVLTESRGADGRWRAPNLPMHAASGILPPHFPAIDGIYIDGAFRRNGPIAGAIPEGDTPLIRFKLGKADFKAYQARYAGHERLLQRAQEAFDFIEEALPTDRPAADIVYPDCNSVRGCARLPTSEDVSRLRAEGRAHMDKEIKSGLLQRLNYRRPMVLAA